MVGEKKGRKGVTVVVESVEVGELRVGDEGEPVLGDALQSDKGFRGKPAEDLAEGVCASGNLLCGAYCS